MVEDSQTTLSPHSLYIYIKWGIKFVCLFVFSVNYLKSKMNQPLKNQKEWNPKWQRFAQSMLTGEASTTSQKPSNLTLRSIYYLVPLSFFVFIYMCPAPFSTHKKEYPQKYVLQSSNSKNKAKNTLTGKKNVQCS